MKAILNLSTMKAPLFSYTLEAKFWQVLNWFNTYKYWILCGITLVSIVLAAGETFGWDQLSE